MQTSAPEIPKEVPRETANALEVLANKRLTAAQSLMLTKPEDATPDQYAAAEAMRNQAHAELLGVEETRTKLKKPILESERALDTFFRTFSTPLQRMKDELGDWMKARNRAVEQRRVDEERRLQAAAETERKRLQAIADEQARLAQEEADRAAQEERDRAAAAAASAPVEIRQSIIEAGELRAQEQIDAGAELVVEALEQVDAARNTPPPFIPREKPRGARETWHGEITDLPKLAMAAVATHIRTLSYPNVEARQEAIAVSNFLQRLAGVPETLGYVHVPMGAILGNTTMVGEQARSQKRELIWPGVRVWSDEGLAASRARR